jgi:N12 class adenine-specific DNA methylase
VAAARTRPSLFDAPPDDPPADEPADPAGAPPPGARPDPAPERTGSPAVAAGEKGKARDILDAIRTLRRVESENRPATADERDALARFAGFGPVALSLFPNPGTGRYRDESWQALGDELRRLLTPDEYASARRTTFNAFYTSPAVIDALHAALARLGVPADGLVLEPGCGSGNFLARAPAGLRLVGVEQDALSGRIARARCPGHDVRIEDFQATRPPAGGFDAVIGNVPFADLKLDHHGHKFALHDYFLAKSVDALAPGGVTAVVTSHFTLDKQNAAAREYLAARADFLGAVRLPSDAFRREGTAVVTDVLFLRKRAAGEPARHADPDWLTVAPLAVEGAEVAVNRYFLRHPEMVLGTWTRKDTLYGEGYGVAGTGDLAVKLRAAVGRLPELPRRPPAAGPAPAAAPAFVPPPAERHVTEGSFFVGDDRRLYQVADGRPEPVVYGGVALTTATTVGRRVSGLVALRDLARRVLRSQNEGWPADHRADARRQLNRAYDAFVAAHGPVNKTTFTPAASGGVVRRTPNLVKFREDPDAMLVMALEEYDEVTGEAAKAPILLRDVVGQAQPVTRVATAEDGLLVSLDHKGGVDLPYIASLYGKPEAAVAAELGDLVYRDPATGGWLPADAYLSGDVRARLRAAEAAGPEYARNAAALRGVQPEDVLPGDIDANLGAPWIPAADIKAFAADLFGVPESSVAVGHLPQDAVWSVDAGYAAERSVAATADYGTARANGTWLLDLALNLRSPVVYDPVPGDTDKRQVNPEATLAAREKQGRIKDRFRQWVFADPDRTERLVRVYNDAFNNLRPRQFDGSHLHFPGMTAAVALNPHQQDAVWRGMSGGNTLLAHAVGAGKTFTMAATGMKLRQAGLVRKPMYVVPNHMLEQFSREFMQLYPNAKLLVAGRDDMGKDRRKLLTAKIASGDWDGIVVTHSGFERIGMSREYQEGFLREQIAEYDRLLVDRAATNATRSGRNIIKTIEKQKAAREARLKDLLAENKKDDGLVFDELGVDHVFIDEAHYFKNLETATKMDRVAGIQTGGSERAFDLLMKARYLHQKHPGRGLTFATGTPVSNTMVELYTLQKYLDPDGLAARGIDHFDAWAATFGEVVEAMEISPDGASLRPRSRFARFVNLPELQQMFRQFADVQTADMLDLPRPALEGGKPHVVACPMSDAQTALQRGLVERYDRLRTEKVDPREDNALAITTDGRKLALDARLLAADAGDAPGSKVNALVETVHRIWQRTAPSRGTQMVFSDLGVQPTSWGFSVYDEVVAKLVARGVPRDQIACVGDADTDAKKQALFDKVRSGAVRVILGSTQKMGAGTNVQKRLVALHHLDAPWKPAEVEQREGRILRQGNNNAEVAVYRYVTEGSFDAYMWQALETKAKFIGQVMNGQVGVRRAEDVAGQELSYAEVKAIASGNPAVLTLAEADAEVQRLSVLRRNHADEQYTARRKVRELPEVVARQERRLADLEADRATAAGGDGGTVVVGGRGYGRADAPDALARALARVPADVDRARRFPLGTYRGLALGIERHPGGAGTVYLEGRSVQEATLSRESQGPRAVLNALARLTTSYNGDCDRVRQELDLARTQLRDYEARLGRPFPQADYLAELTDLRDRLRDALAAPAGGDEAATPSAAELADRLKRLKDSNVGATGTVPEVPRRPTRGRPGPRPPAQAVEAEEPPPPADEPAGPAHQPPDRPPTFRERVSPPPQPGPRLRSLF